MKRWCVGMVVVLAAAACTGGNDRVSKPSQLKRVALSDLIGNWHLSAAEELPGTEVTIGDYLIIWRACGELTAAWNASPSGAFLTAPVTESNGCASAKYPQWAIDVDYIQRDGSGLVLYDRAFNVVASLRPGASPSPGPDIRAGLAKPTLTAQLRERFAKTRAPAIPAGWAGANRTDLIGDWVEPRKLSAKKPEPGLRFQISGTIIGLGTCTGAGGFWAVPRSGEFLVVQGFSLVSGCAGASVADSLGAASGVGIKGGQLAFFDATGKLIAQLKRESSSASDA